MVKPKITTGAKPKKAPPSKRTFYVYFEQVNQTRFEITAADRDSAVKKAARLWREQYSGPHGAYAQEVR